MGDEALREASGSSVEEKHLNHKEADGRLVNPQRGQGLAVHPDDVVRWGGPGAPAGTGGSLST